jgi:hypothetical protein
MTPTPYSLPMDDAPDEGQPKAVHHGCDYMFSDTDALEFYYNFLTYNWMIDGHGVAARAYLDDVDRVSVSMSRAEFEVARNAPVLAFLQRRFRLIGTLESDGYVVQWERERRRGSDQDL